MFPYHVSVRLMARYQSFIVTICLGSSLVFIFWNWKYFSETIVSISDQMTGSFDSNSNCRRRKNITISQIQQICMSDLDLVDIIPNSDQPYLLFLPDGIPLADINQSTLVEAKRLMQSAEYLNAIGGFNNIGVENQTVYCSGFIADWTIYLSRDQDDHKFSQSQSIKTPERVSMLKNYSCRSCFILPYGPILFRTAAFVEVWKSLHAKAPGGVSKYGVGFLFSLLVSLNGTGVYCANFRFIIASSPTSADVTGAKISTYSTIADYSQFLNPFNFQPRTPSYSAVAGSLCSQTFGFPFDQRFVLLADLLDVFRIVLPGGSEAWLNCEWVLSLRNTSVACSNWHFRYLQDAIRLFRDYFHWDYRIVFGTALGAIRDGDIIPWTTDMDIIPVPFPLDEPVDFGQIPEHIREASGWFYDYLAVDNKDHYPVYRLIPRCPVIVNRSHSTSASEMATIAKLFLLNNTTKRMTSDWRNIPYGDLYNPHFIKSQGDGGNLDVPMDLLSAADWSKIRDVPVKSIHHTLRYLDRWYGKHWKTPVVTTREHKLMQNGDHSHD